MARIGCFGVFICLGLFAMPAPLAAEEAARPSVESILRSCSDFSASLTNVSLTCMTVPGGEFIGCKLYKISAALPDRLQVFSDDYFHPVVWNYAFGQVSISFPSSGKLIEHPAVSSNFPFASQGASEESERGLYQSLFLPDLLSGRLADRLLAQATNPTAPVNKKTRHHNDSACYALRIPQTDQTAYELLIQQGPTPFLISIRQVTARAHFQSDLAVEDTVLANEEYSQWQLNSPNVMQKLTEAGPTPEPSEEEAAIVAEVEAPADEASRTNGIPSHTPSSYFKRQNAFLKRVHADHVAKRTDPQLPDRARILKLLADHRHYLLNGTPRKEGERLQVEAERLLNRNPDLPTLRYMVAMLIYFNNQREEMSGISSMILGHKIYPMLESAHQDFLSGPWKNPYLAMRTAFWRGHMIPQFTDPEWAEIAWKLYLDLFKNPWYVKQNAPVLLSVCNEFIGGKGNPISTDHRDLLADFEPVKESNPWLYHMLCGVHFLAKGWDADEYLRAQDPQIQKAIVQFNTAYDLDPSRPEAASYMITAMLARGKRQAMRKWFDRAVQAEMDHPRAYDRFVVRLWPLWGGTHDEWYAFGEECLKTARFDTPVPSQFLDAVHSISEMTDDPLEIYRRPGCYENLMALFNGWQSAPGKRKSKRYWSSRKAAYAWACQHYSEAAEILSHLGPNFDDSVLPELNVSRQQLRNEVELFSSPYRAEAEQAQTLLARGDLAGARQVVEPLLSDLDADAPSRRAFENQLRHIQAQETFDDGQWISLLQPGVIDWNSSGSGWKLRSEELRVQSLSDKPSTVQCRFPIARNFELEGTVEFGERPQPKYREFVSREFKLKLNAAKENAYPDRGMTLMIYEKKPRAVILGIGSGDGQDYVTLEGIRYSDSSTFHIREKHGRIRVTWNDMLLAEGLVAPSPDGQESPYSLSFTWKGTTPGKPGATFTSLKARRTAPAAPAAPAAPPPNPDPNQAETPWATSTR